MSDTPDPTEATVREGKGSTAPRPADAARLSRGTLVGRYVVLDVIGEGGMGVVYAAFDPELDRKVAIKLLQAAAGGSESGGQAWLMREAQAMARLSHPNVIAVHDVGSLPGDRVFVAMELVVGGTLRKWMEAERSWRDVLAVLRPAGAGLAAAHAAGLVHRDFKPDNVLVGDDGRVRVMDFGLARLNSGDDMPAAALEAHSPLSERLTEIGSIVGTPAYMAPELYRGAPADARSDQFSFGVALYEALYRTRPYDKGSFKPGAAPVKPKEPPDAGVPARVRRVVMRAIAIDPEVRYASMDELLAELAIDPARPRRRIMLAAAALGVVGVLGGGAFVIARSRAQLCKGADRKLAGVWDDSIKKTMHDAFVATKLPRAAAAADAVAHVIDAYTSEWTTTAIGNCEATRIHGDQTEQDMALRQDCLDGRVEELRAFTQLLSNADETVVAQAEKGAQLLDPIKQCSNLPMLRSPDKPPPEAHDKVEQLSSMIATAKAALLAGKLGTAINKGNEIVTLARSIRFGSAEAEGLMTVALGQLAAGDTGDATKTLSEAATASLKSRRDDTFTIAAIMSAVATAEGGKDEVARTWLLLAKATGTKLQGDQLTELRLLQAEGIVLAHGNDQRGAIAANEKSLEIASHLYGPEAGIAIATVEQQLGLALIANQEYARARPHLEHAVALIEVAEGPEHVDAASSLGALAQVYGHIGEIAKARATFDRAIAIREKALGKNSPVLLPTLNNVAELLRTHGDPAGAMTYIERALALAQRLGTASSVYHTVATTYAQVLADNGKFDDARTRLDAILALEEKEHSPALADTLVARAEVELKASGWDACAAFAQRAVTTIEAASGKDAPALWVPLSYLGRANVALRKLDAAKPVLERALAIATAAQSPAEDLAPIREALAAAQRK